MVSQFGYIVRHTGDEKAIYLNDTKLVSTIEGTNRFGTYVKEVIQEHQIEGSENKSYEVTERKLYHDGVLLVDGNASDKSIVTTPIVDETNGNIIGADVTFGNVILDTIHKSCINITLENYNKLLHGDVVPGYKLYDRDDVYNIVGAEEINNTDPIYYTDEPDGYRFGNILWPEKHNVVYNNVIGVKTNHNTIDFNNNRDKLDCPYVDIRYFNPVVMSGNSIALKCKVNDLYDSLLKYDTLGPTSKVKVNDGEQPEDGTYTLVIETESGDSVVKTTYAGIICINTPVFTSETTRQSWFTVQVIDSRGVASIKHYLDVYITTESYVPHYFEPTINFLQTQFGIAVPGQNGFDEENNVIGYKNKIGLTKLFAYAKEHGYNGVKLPTQDYYVSYYKNIAASATSTPKLATNSNDTVFKLLHFSDCHGTYDCTGEIADDGSIITGECEKILAADPDINCVVFTGDFIRDDTAGWNTTNQTFVSSRNKKMKAALDIIQERLNSKFLMVYGNHDIYDGFRGKSGNAQSFASKQGSLYIHQILGNNVNWADPVNWGDYHYADSSPSYWFKDFQIKTDSVLRIIGIDQYEYRQGDEVARYGTTYTIEQINWLINCIESLNENDYFIIAMHTPPVYPDDFNDTIPGSTSFCSPNITNWQTFSTNGGAISDIINAYLHNGDFSENPYVVTNADSGTNASFEINHKFENTPAKFLFYLCGHTHADICCYHPVHNDQLILCIDCATSEEGAIIAQSDIPYANREHGHKLLNNITINFNKGTINVDRIGNCKTYNKSTNTTAYRTNIVFNIDPIAPVVPDEETIDLGEQKYYKVQLADDLTFADTPEQIDFYDVLNDTYKLYRYPSTGSYRSDILAVGKNVDENGDSPILYLGDDVWYNLSTDSREYLKNHMMYLRTFKTYYPSDIAKGKLIQQLKVIKDKKDNDVVINSLKGKTVYIVCNTATVFELSSDTSVQEFAENNIYIPDNFTVDLNGSRLIATKTYAIDKGRLVAFFKNIDSHIINSNINKTAAIVGLYSRYDFLKAHLATGHNTVGESNHVLSTCYSKFCGIDGGAKGIEISDALGYECTFNSYGLQGGVKLHSSTSNGHQQNLFNNRYIDNLGNDVVDTNAQLVTSDFLRISVSDDNPYLSVGRAGYAGYVGNGKRHEIFIFFYNNNKEYLIGTELKTKFYQLFRVPTNARYLKIVGYGELYRSDLNPNYGLYAQWVGTTSAGALNLLNPSMTIGCVIKNCYIHDTRTTAITNPQARQILFDNITYERCATTKYLGISSGGSITPLLGDFEDSWQWCKYITMRNCKHIKDKTQSSSSTLLVYNCEHFHFENNEGFSMTQGGGVESGLIANNHFTSLLIMRTRSCFHPQIEYTDNVINKGFSVSTKAYDTVANKSIDNEDEYVEPATSTDDTIVVPQDEPQNSEDDEEIYAHEVQLYDKYLDDTMEPVVACSNSTFGNPISHSDFKLRKCKVDSIKVDYFY